MRVVLVLVTVAVAAAQTEDSSSPEDTVLLTRIQQSALEDLSRIPNYVCFDSIERSLWIPGEREFRRLDRMHLELAHIGGVDRFSWLGDSAFQSKTPSEIVGYGASFRGDFADNRALVFKNRWTRIRYTGRETIEGRPAMRYEYEVPRNRGGLAVAIGSDSGFVAARGAFWVDPETLDLLRIDVEGHDIPASLSLQSAVARTTYWRVLIGERGVVLARNSEFLLTERDGTVKRNLSVFSNCREYRAESTVTFGPNLATQPSTPGMQSTRVPAGLQLQLVLDTPLDVNKVAVGDSVRAHVLERSGEVPKGAQVYGRVNRLIRYNDQTPSLGPAPKARHAAPRVQVWGQHLDEILIGIEFSQLEYRRSRAPFTARLIAVESQSGKRDTQIRGFGYFGDDTMVRYDPPGAASLYISEEDPVLRRGLIMRWVTVESQRGS